MELSEILYQKTVDQLKQLAQLADDCHKITRKDDLVGCIRAMMLSPAALRQLWRQLDDLAQKAVTSAYHNDGEFNEAAFVAQYGQLPARPQHEWWSWRYQPILLDLFIYDTILPSDLIPVLQDLVPPPERFQVQGLTNAPKVVMSAHGAVIALMAAETEQIGLHDLTAYLRLVAQGALGISTSSRKITLSSIRKIVDSLMAEDFLPLPDKYRANETIRPSGLDVFARGAGLVTDHSYGLQLTETGQQYYQSQDPEILLEAFERWTQTGTFDELSRISALKGLGARATRLTQPTTRREAIIEALSWCPVNVWIDIQDFYRAVKIWHFDFDVETTFYSNLYVGSQEYGMLYGDDYWTIIKGLYINVVLWEYLGTIGAVDLLYTNPEEAGFAESVDIYYDESYSLFDGLKYFRINNLGAYLLGQAGEYVPSQPLAPAIFTISADRTVTITQPDAFTPNDQYQLVLMAEPLENGHYRLDTQRILTALEEGHDWQYLVDFLRDRHDGLLPDKILAWLEEIRENSQVFKKGETALFIKVQSAEVAEMVMADSILRKFCKQIDSRILVIPANKEKAFRKRLKELEYVLLG